MDDDRSIEQLISRHGLTGVIDPLIELVHNNSGRAITEHVIKLAILYGIQAGAREQAAGEKFALVEADMRRAMRMGLNWGDITK